MPVGSSRDAPPQSNILPTGVIPGELYLGSYDTASRSELLKTMGISHILNTVPSCQTMFKNTFAYHTASTSPPDFAECFKFLDTVRASGGKALVFCMSGISRSPTVVIAYLMQHRCWRLAESYKWVKEKRPTISIREDDSLRLAELEMQLYGSSSVPHGLAALTTSGNGFATAPAAGQVVAGPSASQQPLDKPPPHQAHASTPPSAPFGQLAAASWTMPTAAFSGSFGGTIATPPAFVFGGGAATNAVPAAVAPSRRDLAPSEMET